jgi:DNA polymerase-1
MTTSILTEFMAHDKPLVLVDGSSYLFRAFHALPNLSTTSGVKTGAIRGVIGMLKRLAKDFVDSPIAVVFDAKGRSFRNDLYTEYKANRTKMPDELRDQIAPIHDIIRAMGLPLLIIDGVEADDVIGTLAREATAKKREVVISTSDKDLAQLVSEHVTLVDTMTESRLDRAGVIEKFGVPPERIIDYLALMGDTSDNIPGVPKVGPKTAAKWLNDYGTLEDVIAQAANIGGKVGENLRASLGVLPLSKQLTTIKSDVVLDVGVEDLVPTPMDLDRLRSLFEQFEFRPWLDELPADERAVAAVIATKHYETIDDVAQLDRWLERIRVGGRVSLHTEITGRDYMQPNVVGFAFAVDPGEAVFVRFGREDTPLAPDRVIERLKPMFEDPATTKLGENPKFDKNVLANLGVELNGIAFDTMLESYVLDSVGSKHTIEDLAERLLGLKLSRVADATTKPGKASQPVQASFDDAANDRTAIYAAEDADLALRVHERLWPKLEAEPRLKAVFTEIEMPLVGVLSRMECAGAMVDGQLLRSQSQELAQRAAELEREAFDLAGEAFNLDSTKQLQAILYDKLGLPVTRKTPGGQPSTAEPVLAELALDYPLPRVIMDYRSLTKLKSTYTDKLPLQINPRTSRIHTSYQQAVAATGRLSSADPNLQNIPVRTVEGRRIRQAFIAPPGRKLLAADYSQIELRIMAHLSRDEGLRNAFDGGLDVHRATAAEVFGVPVESVTADQRRSAKAINFGLIYGMSAFGLGRQLGVSRSVATEYIGRYFARYPGVRRYMDDVRTGAAQRGYVETVFGRRLYLPEINASNGMRRQAAERTAINAPMQGTAADIIKRAMIAVDAWLADADIGATMILQVHDELIFEVDEADIERLAVGVVERMQTAANLDVALVVDVGVGNNWDEAH